MSINTKHLSKKRVAAGAALVALSGFAPQPLMQQAQAASATMKVTGSFITGVQLFTGTSAKFGVLAVTGANGKATLSTAGAVTPSNAVKVGAASTNGSIKINAVSTAVSMDVTVKGLGPITLSASAGGGGPTGTPSLSKVVLGGAGLSAALTVVQTAGTSGAVVSAVKAASSATTKAINIGGTVTWGATQPIGQFVPATAITVIMAF